MHGQSVFFPLYIPYLQNKGLITQHGAGSKMFSKEKYNKLHPSSHLPIDALLSGRADILQCEPGIIFVHFRGVEQLLLGD